MKILAVAPGRLHPAPGQGKYLERYYRRVVELAEHHDVTLVAVDGTSATWQGADERFWRVTVADRGELARLRAEFDVIVQLALAPQIG